jgi:hypothetical protein
MRFATAPMTITVSVCSVSERSLTVSWDGDTVKVPQEKGKRKALRIHPREFTIPIGPDEACSALLRPGLRLEMFVAAEFDMERMGWCRLKVLNVYDLRPFCESCADPLLPIFVDAPFFVTPQVPAQQAPPPARLASDSNPDFSADPPKPLTSAGAIE